MVTLRSNKYLGQKGEMQILAEHKLCHLMAEILHFVVPVNPHEMYFSRAKVLTWVGEVSTQSGG